VPRGLGAARCTGVILTDTMAMRPTIIPRERFVDRPRSSRSAGRGGCRDFSQSLRELLVGRSERGVGCGEHQVSPCELLEDCGVVSRRKCQVVERCSQAVDGAGGGR
jgi:hypothetical protein